MSSDAAVVSPAERHGDIADEGHEHVGNDADRDREREPLRERRDEAQVRVETPARIDIAAAGARHGRCEDGVGHRGQHGRERRERKGFQHKRTDAGDVALDHERDHVDTRADHRADAGGGQAGEAHVAREARVDVGRDRDAKTPGHLAFTGALIARPGRAVVSYADDPPPPGRRSPRMDPRGWDAGVFVGGPVDDRRGIEDGEVRVGATSDTALLRHRRCAAARDAARARASSARARSSTSSRPRLVRSGRGLSQRFPMCADVPARFR